MILAVGDSFTYGDELADRLTSAWPYRLAEQLGDTLVNLAEPGCSNDTMLRLAVEHTAKEPYDLVIVGWTAPGRVEVWSELSRRPVTIMQNSLTGLPWIDDYYRYSYDLQYSYQQWFRQIVLLQQYFKSRNQPYVFVGTTGLYEEHLEYPAVTDLIDTTHYVGWPNQGMLTWTKDLPKGPGGHPLESGHEQIAKHIYEHIRN